MKAHILGAAMLVLASCTVNSLSGGVSVPDLGWLITGSAPYTLNTKVDAAPGPATFQLVSDRSLMFENPEIVFTADVEVLADSTISVPLGNIGPGFYEVRLRDSLRWNIGIEPEKVVSAPDSKADFDAFWDSTLAELAGIPLEAELIPVPEHSDDYVESYQVHYKSLGGATAGGILVMPSTPGKYPVCVEYMGYGAEPFYPYDKERIRFLVSVREQGIFKDPEERWIDRGLESRESFYYRGAFCDVRRAVEFVCTLPKADVDRIYVMGESQGGAFSIVSAAISPEVKAASAAVPFLGDYPDYARIVWWPVHEVLQTLELEEQWYSDASAAPVAELFNMLSYFDVKNFAPKVKCPVIMGFGLQDQTCPPHTNFAIYNNLGSQIKTYVCIPTCGHGIWMESAWPPLRDAFLNLQIAL